MKRARCLWFGGGLLALVVVLFVAGVPAESAPVIAALPACSLMILLATSRSSANNAQTAHEPTP